MNSGPTSENLLWDLSIFRIILNNVGHINAVDMEATCRLIDACVGCWLVSAILMWCQVSVTDLRSQATWAVCPKRNHSFHWVRNMLFTGVVELERASLIAWESWAGRRRPTPHWRHILTPNNSSQRDPKIPEQGVKGAVLPYSLRDRWWVGRGFLSSCYLCALLLLLLLSLDFIPRRRPTSTTSESSSDERRYKSR